LIEFETNLLENVGACFRVTADAPGNGIDQALIPGNQLLPCLLIAFDTTLDKISIS